MNFRMLLGLPLAAAITAGLFIVMAGMIRQEEPPPEPGLDSPKIEIIAKKKSTPPTKSEWKRPTTQEPPEIDIPDTGRQPKPTPGPGPFGEPTATDDTPGDFPVNFATPVIKAPPQYPEQCRSSNAEGTVVVQFDVTDKGEVTNVRIISSDHRCFDRAVTRAILGWRYPPERRQGLIETFTFRLTD